MLPQRNIPRFCLLVTHSHWRSVEWLLQTAESDSLFMYKSAANCGLQAGIAKPSSVLPNYSVHASNTSRKWANIKPQV